MASPGNQHCANCIGTLSFPIYLLFVYGSVYVMWNYRYRIDKYYYTLLAN